MTESPEPEYLVQTEGAPQIFLSEPDEAWVTQYAAEERRICEALGPLPCAVHHAGSTAVPGLPAKPVIDILLTVPDTSDEAAYVQPLEAAGYTFYLREPHWHQHRLFKSGTPHLPYDEPRTRPRVNLHVFPDGCDEVHRMLVFRDWLTENEDDRILYAKTKRRLAADSWERVQDYADAKTDVVNGILRRALQGRVQPSKGEGSPAPTRTTSG